MLDAQITAVALGHLAVRSKGRNSIRAGHCAAVTADAICRIVDGHSRFRVFAQAGRGTSDNTRCIGAVHTSQRQMMEANLSIFQLLHIENIAARASAILHNKIVLVHTCHCASAAGDAFAHIQINDVPFHAKPSFSFHSG